MKHSILFFLSFTLAACGANIEIHKPIPPELITDSKKGGYSSINIRADEITVSNDFIRLLSSNIGQHLSELSLYPKKESAMKVHILIIGYNIKRGASREVMGTLAGSDKVKSQIQVINKNTNKIIGESTVFTSSAMAYGTNGMAWVHADDIASFLSTAN